MSRAAVGDRLLAPVDPSPHALRLTDPAVRAERIDDLLAQRKFVTNKIARLHAERQALGIKDQLSTLDDIDTKLSALGASY